jgi:hypothetical protein
MRSTTYQASRSRCSIGGVKTITITITEELDLRAVAEAKRMGVSKSELIRRGLRAVLPDETVMVDDPWVRLAGFADPDAHTVPGEIDDVVYR